MIDMQKSTAYPILFQFLFLILMAIVGAVVFTILGFVFWYLTSNKSLNISDLQTNNPLLLDINLLRSIQIGSSIGLFIAGPIAFAYIMEVKPKRYFYFDETLKVNLFLITLVLIFCAMPLLEFSTVINQELKLPAAFSDLEAWMKNSEAEAAMVTKKLLQMKGMGDLLINLLMIAIIPAIGEELFFRGGLQNILGQWFKNHHAAIWVTAIVFSSIHLQFYGFLPRMLLGALFGYLLVYSKNMWLPILGHFINNGSAVVMAYIYQQQGKNLDDLDNINTFNNIGYAISAVLTIVLLYFFFKLAKTQKSDISYEQQLG
jgi:membrane protease YdiL (CAAX protease family)